MLSATYGSVSDIELVWTIISVVGLGFGAFNLKDALGDLKALNMAGIKNGRRIIAKFAIRQEILRMTMQAIFACIGILAMFLPEPPSEPLTTKEAFVGFLIRWGLIVSATIVLTKSIDGYITRHRLTGD